jgi:hypothetical protein
MTPGWWQAAGLTPLGKYPKNSLAESCSEVPRADTVQITRERSNAGIAAASNGNAEPVSRKPARPQVLKVHSARLDALH